ncbi:hypothetical protein AB1Y20_018708 [Prymnesium parvum]|uniref:GAF domain-containing protein n=1 Tax=Prymnesium parvum TaxID=97485 RepID=A0AB34JPH4_PRYPA
MVAIPLLQPHGESSSAMAPLPPPGSGTKNPRHRRQSPRSPPREAALSACGTAMSSVSWRHTESTPLPAGAPVLYPPPLPRAELLSTDALQPVATHAEPSADAGRKMARMSLKTAATAVTEAAQLSHLARERPPAVAQEVSGPRACQALLQSEMLPASFATYVAQMPWQKRHTWLEHFARCVTLLGETMTSLQTQIKVQLGRKDKDRMRQLLNQMRAQCRAMRAALDELRQEVKRETAHGERAVVRVLIDMARAEARATRVRALWNRALFAAIMQVQRDKRRLVRTIATLGSMEHKSLQPVADIICDTCLDLFKCGQAHVFVADTRPPLAHPVDPILHRLVARTASPAEVKDADGTALDCRTRRIQLDSLVGDAASAPPGKVGAQVMHLKARAMLHRRFCKGADDVSGFPPPNELVYVSLTHAGMRSAVRLSDIRKDFLLGAHLSQRLHAFAPLFSLALKTAYVVSEHPRNRDLCQLFARLPVRIVPYEKDPVGLSVLRAEKVAYWKGVLESVLWADRCTLFLYDAAADKLVAYADQTDKRGIDVLMQCDPSDFGGFAVQCALMRRALNRREIVAAVDPISGYRTVGVIAAPIFSPTSGALIGVCEMFNKQGPSGPYFSSDDESLVQGTLKVLALDLENRVLCLDLDKIFGGKPKAGLFGAE